MKPLAYLLVHKDVVVQVLDMPTRESWETLCRALPEIQNLMSLNTWKMYKGHIRDFNEAMLEMQAGITPDEVTNLRSELEAARIEIESRKHKITRLRSDIDGLLGQLAQRDEELTKLRSIPKVQGPGQSMARNIDGWTVRKSPDGRYYRLYKSINGKVHSIHIGKDLDEAKARQKIREMMVKLREQEGAV